MSSEAAVALALDQPAGEGSGRRPAGGEQGRLTRREREIVGLIAEGRTNKAIAEELFISPATAARHVANILAKLGFTSRTQIAAWVADRPPEPGPAEATEGE
jgi:non-specific serine/threonine protein kinase